MGILGLQEPSPPEPWEPREIMSQCREPANPLQPLSLAPSLHPGRKFGATLPPGGGHDAPYSIPDQVMTQAGHGAQAPPGHSRQEEEGQGQDGRHFRVFRRQNQEEQDECILCEAVNEG